ncbi:MAG: nuclear transport factor 2 family protein [Ginsengibacter sp.]
MLNFIKEKYEGIINRTYDAFNARDIDTVLSVMHQHVPWPNGWEGGYRQGHREVRNYWTRQWKELNPIVKPVPLAENENVQIIVQVEPGNKRYAGKCII